jgi:hypothetical protein
MEDKRLKLKPTLGLLDATAISVGAIIGAGIFVVTGIMAGSYQLISLVIAAHRLPLHRAELRRAERLASQRGKRL